MGIANTVFVGGVETIRHSRTEMTELMVDDCEKARVGTGPTRLIFDLNGHGVALSRWDPSFRRDLARADVVHAEMDRPSC